MAVPHTSSHHQGWHFEKVSDLDRIEKHKLPSWITLPLDGEYLRDGQINSQIDSLYTELTLPLSGQMIDADNQQSHFIPSLGELKGQLIRTSLSNRGAFEFKASDPSSHPVDRNILSKDDLNRIIAGNFYDIYCNSQPMLSGSISVDKGSPTLSLPIDITKPRSILKLSSLTQSSDQHIIVRRQLPKQQLETSYTLWKLSPL